MRDNSESEKNPWKNIFVGVKYQYSSRLPTCNFTKWAPRIC